MLGNFLVAEQLVASQGLGFMEVLLLLFLLSYYHTLFRNFALVLSDRLNLLHPSIFYESLEFSLGSNCYATLSLVSALQFNRSTFLAFFYPFAILLQGLEGFS